MVVSISGANERRGAAPAEPPGAASFRLLRALFEQSPRLLDQPPPRPIDCLPRLGDQWMGFPGNLFRRETSWPPPMMFCPEVLNHAKTNSRQCGHASRNPFHAAPRDRRENRGVSTARGCWRNRLLLRSKLDFETSIRWPPCGKHSDLPPEGDSPAIGRRTFRL